MHRPVKCIHDLSLLAILTCFALGCGSAVDDDPVDTPDSGTMVDAGAEEDASPPDDDRDTGADTAQEDASVDAEDDESDTGLADSDGDGVADADDNCPDAPNDMQEDADRDGIGDACDALPNIHAPDGEADVTEIMEDESTIPNDDALQGEAYDASLPIRVDGTVGVTSSGVEGDVDYYSFRVEEPSAVRVHLEGAVNVWPAAIFIGYKFGNANMYRALLGDEAGKPAAREFFVPSAGQYAIAVSDRRNFEPGTADVGGAGMNYTLTVSTVPLPDSEDVQLPTAPLASSFDGELTVYEVDVADVDALELTATGVPLDQDAFHSPAVSVVDPDSGQSLAYTVEGAVNESMGVDLRVKTGDVDRVMIVEDYAQRWRSSSTSLEVRGTTIDADPETVADPLDTRDANLVWLTPGSALDANIGPPRASGPTELDGDVDYFAIQADRGDHVKITVRPTGEQKLLPLVDLGYFLLRDDGSDYLYTHRAPEATSAGMTGRLEYYFSDVEEGEVVIRVQHDDNRFADNPVGGADYGYTIEVEEWSPTPASLGSVPTSGPTTMGAGGLGIVEFDATEGDVLHVKTDGDGLYLQNRVIGVDDWREVTRADGGFFTKISQTGTYRLDMHDYFDRRSPGAQLDADLVVAQVEAFGAIPGVVSGVFDSTTRVIYSADVSAGDVLDVRVQDENFEGRLKVWDAEFNELDSTTNGRIITRVPTDGPVYVRLRSTNGKSGADVTYDLGIQKAAPSPLGALPASVTGVVDDQPHATWYLLDVTSGTTYDVVLSTDDSDFEPKVRLYDPADLDKVAGSGNDAILDFTASSDGQRWIAVSDAENRGSSAYTYTLDVTVQ